MASPVLVTVLPWAGGVVAAGIVGAVVGVTGLVGHPTERVSTVGTISGFTPSVDVASCPGGPVIGSLPIGTRVLAIARSDDSSILGVRDPRDSGRTVWVSAAEVEADASQPAISTLSIEACPVVGGSSAGSTAPAPTATPSPSGNPTGEPTPADAESPTITSANATPNDIFQKKASPDKSTISVAATDNVGVTSITATWPAVGEIPAGSTEIGGSSGSFTFGPFPFTGNGPYDVPISLVAHDAAGNSSAPTVVHVTLELIAL
jgi:hypothetical protein